MENGENKSGAMRSGMKYFSNTLKVTLGAGAALGGAYLLSRVGEKQSTESSLSRLEQMLSELVETREAEQPGVEQPATRRRR